jgi:hypothetical protein
MVLELGPMIVHSIINFLEGMEVIASLAVLEAAADTGVVSACLLPLSIRTRIAHMIVARECLVGFPIQINILVLISLAIEMDSLHFSGLPQKYFIVIVPSHHCGMVVPLIEARANLT